MQRAAVMVVAFLLDMMLGDPLWLPHPVVAMGKLIAALERRWRNATHTPAQQQRWGALLALVVVLAAAGGAGLLLWLLEGVHPALRMAGEVFFFYQLLATKCLRDAGMKVYHALQNGDMAAARAAVGEIVGRETHQLDESEIIRATVETIAENSSDGVIAPLFYFAVGGLPLAAAYKAINTLDSMLGYKNQRYLYFGRFSAKMDDLANLLPARLTALWMVVASALCGLDAKGAWRCWRRDRKKHPSPNAAQPEAACAGALGVQLGGDSRYFGRVVHKQRLGDALRPLEPEDIRRAGRLLYATAALGLCLLAAGLLLVWVYK